MTAVLIAVGIGYVLGKIARGPGAFWLVGLPDQGNSGMTTFPLTATNRTTGPALCHAPERAGSNPSYSLLTNLITDRVVSFGKGAS
jgi:hypothetical protein